MRPSEKLKAVRERIARDDARCKARLPIVTPTFDGAYIGGETQLTARCEKPLGHDGPHSCHGGDGKQTDWPPWPYTTR